MDPDKTRLNNPVLDCSGISATARQGSGDIVVTGKRKSKAKPQSGRRMDNSCATRATDRGHGPFRQFEVDPATVLPAALNIWGNKHGPSMSGSGKSYFSGDIMSAVGLYNKIGYAIQSGQAVRTSDAGSEFGRLRITMAMGALVGTSRGSDPASFTQYMTVILEYTGATSESGRPEAIVINAYPGC